MEKKVCFENSVQHFQEKPCIIEFHSFRGNENEYIIKELVIFDLIRLVPYSFLFKPPFSFKKLSTKAKTTNKWITNHLHHISWSEGFTSYDNVDTIMYHFCSKFNKFYTRGTEKCKWIELYTTGDVINVKVDGEFEVQYNDICIYAKNPRHATSQCAFKSVYRLSAFLQDNSGGGNEEYKYQEPTCTQHEYYCRLQRDNTDDGISTQSAISS